MAVTTPLGVKRICPSCSARFYDLNKKPATCPKCAHSYDPTVQVRARRARRSAGESALDSQDLLIQHMAKTKTPAKKKDKDEDIEGFGMEPAVEEEIEDIDDIQQLEELDDIEDDDGGMDDDVSLEDDDVVGEVLIDDVDDEIQAEEAELAADEAEETSKRAKKKPAPVPVKKKKK